MREILFRGQRVDTEEWVEGSLLIDGEKHRPLDKPHLDFSNVYIVPETERDITKCKFNNGGHYLNIEGFHVDSKTVGQFTGLTDKNGKKIFEGDILKRTNGNKYVWYVDYKNCAFCANQSNCNYACELGELLDQIELEVIGNIHDNPEMLEE